MGSSGGPGLSPGPGNISPVLNPEGGKYSCRARNTEAKEVRVF